jgi:hypothetical protein
MPAPGFRSITTSMKDDEVAMLNARLAKDGFASVGDLLRSYASGILTNNSLVQPLADELANRITSKLPSTTYTEIPIEYDNERGKRARWDLNPRPPAPKASTSSTGMMNGGCALSMP